MLTASSTSIGLATAENLSAALDNAAAGGFVFPALCSWNDKTGKLDKKPAISEWRAKATTDPEQIKALWRQFPAAVPGIELGRSNLFVVDLDRHPGGADGVANFKEFRGDNPAPKCPTVRTPAAGFHLYFKQPDGAPLTNRTGTRCPLELTAVAMVAGRSRRGPPSGRGSGPAMLRSLPRHRLCRGGSSRLSKRRKATTAQAHP